MASYALQAPKPSRSVGVTKGMARRRMPKPVGITSKQVAFQVGARLRRSGVRIGGATIQLPEGANLDNFANVMRGAGYAIHKEDLRKLQRR